MITSPPSWLFPLCIEGRHLDFLEAWLFASGGTKQRVGVFLETPFRPKIDQKLGLILNLIPQFEVILNALGGFRGSEVGGWTPAIPGKIPTRSSKFNPAT